MDKAIGSWMSLARALRKKLFYLVKAATFSLLKTLDPDFRLNLVGSTVSLEKEAAEIAATRRKSIASAVVLNSDQSLANLETLEFYLRGIFSDRTLFDRAMSLFSYEAIGGMSFEQIEARLDREAILAMHRGSPEDLQFSQLFLRHREMKQRNLTAYVTKGKQNPNAVFWPDPTDPRNGRSLYTELPFAKRIPLINKSTAIVSAGSCFATEIAHALQRNGYNYIIKEQNRGKHGSYEFLDTGELPNSSAAWGVIFNTPSFRQLAEKAFEVRSLPKILWTSEFAGKLRYLDPFRENIAFESPEAFEANYQEHITATREAFLEMEVLIITLGLNEVWYFKADGSIFSRSPWRIAPSLVGHRSLSVQDNVDDLVRMREILKAHNPTLQIICTLSPIGLHATFRGDEQHVVTANAHSKAVLRVAAEEFDRMFDDVHYFPSYEAVICSTERPWIADQRHVSPSAVENVMTLFHKVFQKE